MAAGHLACQRPVHWAKAQLEIQGSSAAADAVDVDDVDAGVGAGALDAVVLCYGDVDVAAPAAVVVDVAVDC